MKQNKNYEAKVPTSVRLMTNRFVQRLFDIYDKAYMPKEEDFERMKVSDPDARIIPKKKFKKVNRGLELAYQDAMDSLVENPDELYIDVIEDFCDFVRVAEKIAFYQNDKTKDILVDSTVQDNHKRLVISNDQFIIAIQTYLGSYCHDKNGNNTLEINVERLYGKKMQNKFIVVNREIQYNDDSDMYLMNTINIILMTLINKTLKEVYDMVKEKRIRGTY